MQNRGIPARANDRSVEGPAAPAWRKTASIMASTSYSIIPGRTAFIASTWASAAMSAARLHDLDLFRRLDHAHLVKIDAGSMIVVGGSGVSDSSRMSVSWRMIF